MASIWISNLHAASFPGGRISSNLQQFPVESVFNCNCLSWNGRRKCSRKCIVRAESSDNKHKGGLISKSQTKNAMKHKLNLIVKLQETVGSVPQIVVSTGNYSGMSLVIGFCIAATMLVVVVRGYAAKKSRYNSPGSVADLVRRGQLRSDRRGISTPLKYEDPFNNPMVKVSKSNSTVEMCGKVYRLAPVTLTEEQQTIHQRRRSRAYQWKRPTIFLKEGESIPPDVDPDTVRWIPANHPFATTASDLDEDLAQTNVYQKNGIPFRIKAEHEALQKKLEALQNEQKLGKLIIDPAAARDFERPLRTDLKSDDQDCSTSNSQLRSNPLKSDHTQILSAKKPEPEET